MYGRFYTFEMFWRELEGREVLGIGFVLLVTTSFVPRCSTLRLLNSVIAGHSAHFFCMRLKFTISTRPTLYLYFRKQEVYRISAIKRRGYYLFHHVIYCGYYSRAATNRRRRLLNSKRGNGLEHRVCTKKFWYCHNHSDKTVGNAKAITVTKDFAGHTSLAPVPRPQKTPNA